MFAAISLLVTPPQWLAVATDVFADFVAVSLGFAVAGSVDVTVGYCWSASQPWPTTGCQAVGCTLR